MINNTPKAVDIQQLTQQAIYAAMSLNWENAIKINKKILKHSKTDIEALNRLAKAKICSGNMSEAQKIYKKVLTLDKFNIIARKNLNKISKSPNSSPNGKNHTNGQLNTQTTNLSALFLFEPGKTKLINLLNLAPPQVLATLNSGDQVLINPKNHSVTISTIDNVYLGALPDDLAHRLIAFTKGGNKYDAYIKCTNLKILTIFIREVYRSPKFISQPSFQTNQIYPDERN